ncbi:MAG: GyrI-like domain-containing protein [Planctomycetes bacterium]|nr:GyrI-like domain-containing protein [Planctomycetota bacterium]MCB9910441.1 GyrI-like domain-containing protein [Planctomycetota bacterium]MCB9912567.1 GyrI-like domain-containing protein [Planctomycetota bacterium]HPF15274.1 GyrI-like domain-containing protein [Planctomycetota bacterium]
MQSKPHAPFRSLVFLGALLGILAGCAAYSGSTSPTRIGSGNSASAQTVYVPDLPIGHPPYDRIDASWKQRLDQPYVYMEHIGSYTETGTLLPALHRELAAQGLEPAGAPFCLFYEDPALVPVAQLRSRACVPIAGARSPKAPLAYDVLPSTTVAYAFVSGAYPDVPRGYAGVYQFMKRMNWVENGPIREIYLVPPTPGIDSSELVAEIQIPAAPRASR